MAGSPMPHRRETVEQRMGEENVCAGADYNPFHDPFAR